MDKLNQEIVNLISIATMCDNCDEEDDCSKICGFAIQEDGTRIEPGTAKKKLRRLRDNLNALDI